MKRYFLPSVIFFGMLFFSCKQNPTSQEMEEESLFTEIHLPEFENSSLPYLFSDGKSLLLSFVTQTDTLTTLYYSELIDNQWSNPEMIISGTDWFVNWADYPQISKNGDNYIAHILKKSDTTTYAYDVFVTQKQEGSSWATPFKIHRDTTKTEHGFVSYTPFGESQFMVSWLDGRNTTGGHHGHEGGAMTLRAAIVNNDGTLDEEFQLDESVCDCCQTTMAMTQKGPVVVYRDRSSEEVRDISIVRWIDGNLTKPQTVHRDNWQINGCPVNGPRAAAYGNALTVAWFTAADDVSKVNLAFSKNSGKQFNNPVRVDSGNPLGRVDVEMLDDTNALVSWVEDMEGAILIKFRKVSNDGTLGEVKALISTDASRSSGFPQMEVLRDKVYFSWTDLNEKIPQVKTSFYALENL